MADMQQLLTLMARLRDPVAGCPWDLEQDFKSIVPHTLEEAYEVAQSIESGDLTELCDELGDLLFQVVFYAQLAQERGAFDFEKVVAAIAAKIVRRHPHVFGTAARPDAAEQHRSWETIKAEERRAKQTHGAAPPGALDGVARALPALPRAVKLQRRAARVGFDWDAPQPVLEKIHEELAELEVELDAGAGQDRLEDELGDVLFACANLARHLQVDAEAALRHTNAKFERRFRRLEAILCEADIDATSADLETLESAWQQAKREELER
ncbi:nucleoside triphosphate pyrophosphohydrolase [Nitrococcus mobilis]|uniref:Nucleoside triphosphate pyrophosphohydrolase n=1 Tax=Nitrococcus mobilis Nb-231 TaxID=314278 RepID=A4BUP1_9GAMM|nr:nucleoside triphosphate pyrophosphohydrolase [Nitrococcus mobilis]EAR20607.1 Predicted pyrophosphatase [Nitrococcus mobilis Nb-231]